MYYYKNYLSKYLLVIISLFLYSFNQEIFIKEYDKITKRMVYKNIQNMPIYKNGNNFHNDFAKSIKVDENTPTKIILEFVIDKKGFLIGERIYKKSKKDWNEFEISCLKSLKLMQNWKPGNINNEPVNVIMKFPIHLDYQDQ